MRIFPETVHEIFSMIRDRGNLGLFKIIFRIPIAVPFLIDSRFSVEIKSIEYFQFSTIFHSDFKEVNNSIKITDKIPLKSIPLK